MSIEFVEPEIPAEPTPDVGPRPSALPGRLVGAAAALAAVLTGVGLTRPLYAVVRTASIVDFDRTDTLQTRLPVDAFGDASRVALDPAEGVTRDSSVTASVSAPDGVRYGLWWLGVAIVLLVVAVWALARPRASAPRAFVAALGGVLLGSVGAAWLAIRTVAATSVPQLQLAADPDLGFWLLVAAGALALLTALLVALRR